MSDMEEGELSDGGMGAEAAAAGRGRRHGGGLQVTFSRARDLPVRGATLPI